MSETAAQPDDETLADLEEAMRDVVDPELGINVVDLGLVYGLNIEAGDAGSKVALIDMTLTSAACPLTDVIEDQSRPRWWAPGWSTRSRSTGCGIRRGARTRSPRTAASSSGHSASRSDGCAKTFTSSRAASFAASPRASSPVHSTARPAR